MCTTMQTETRGIAKLIDANPSLLQQRSSVATALDAVQILADHYGIRSKVKQLSGERDDNFLVDDGSRFLFLKIVNEYESEIITMGQTAVLHHIERVNPDIPVPRIIPTLHGKDIADCMIHGRQRYAYLETAVAGEPARRAVLDDASTAGLGEMLAVLSRALESFHHPALQYPNIWNSADLDMLMPLAACIENDAKRTHLCALIHHFAVNVKPKLSEMRTQAVHNDFSADNIFIDSKTGRVTGIVDFGDMAFAPQIVDVASAAAYQLSVPRADEDICKPIVDLLRGYEHIRPLSRQDKELLPRLLIARMATRLTITEWRATQFPENVEYILRNNQNTWRQLECLERVDASIFIK